MERGAFLNIHTSGGVVVLNLGREGQVSIQSLFVMVVIGCGNVGVFVWRRVGRCGSLNAAISQDTFL